jgi:hypothetical protein
MNEQQLNSLKRISERMSLHDFIVASIMCFNPVVKEVSVEQLDLVWCDESIDYNNMIVNVYVFREEKDWIGEGKTNFFSLCYSNIEGLVKGLKIEGEKIDAYFSTLFGDELLLNNYDADFYEQNQSEKGFCNVLGFATVNKDGKVRFTQIVYSFLFKRLIVRDDVMYQLPFIPNLRKDFGGKRAVYRNGSTLSLRTNLSVYDKVAKKYWQSERSKGELSYPRLLLR